MHHESTELLRRVGMGVAGVVVLVDTALLLGVLPVGQHINWSNPWWRGGGILLFGFGGFLGLCAPVLRRATQAMHPYMVTATLCIGAVANITATLVYDSSERPLVGGFPVTYLAWLTIAGGLCFLYTALARARPWVITPTSGLHPFPRSHVTQ